MRCRDLLKGLIKLVYILIALLIRSSGALDFRPRAIRLKNAPHYLGMNKNFFNEVVRPKLTEIPIGSQGIAFDRLEIDAWFEEYKRCNGRPPNLRRNLWDAETCQDSLNAGISGTSTKKLQVDAFAKALVQATAKKRKGT